MTTFIERIDRRGEQQQQQQQRQQMMGASTDSITTTGKRRRRDHLPLFPPSHPHITCEKMESEGNSVFTNTSSAVTDQTVERTSRRHKDLHQTFSSCSQIPFQRRVLMVVAVLILIVAFTADTFFMINPTDAFNLQQQQQYYHRHESQLRIRPLVTTTKPTIGTQPSRTSISPNDNSVVFVETSSSSLSASKIDEDTDTKKKNDNSSGSNTPDSWSKPATSSSSSSPRRKGSPLQVRKRVRAVLEKARTRTGVRNNSSSSNNVSRDEPSRGASSVVAEAASIGGLGVDGSADLVLDSNASNSNRLNGAVKNGATPQQPQGSDQMTSSTSSESSSTQQEVAEISDEQLNLGKVNGVVSPPSPASPMSNGAAASSTDNTAQVDAVPARKPKDFDVIRGDVPAANRFVEPLPFELPDLSEEQKQQLRRGERVQEQARMGREGSGFVVLDVKAPPFVVWECLLDFESYPDMIPTVRQMQLYTSEKLNIGYVNEKPVMPGTGRATRHYGTPSVTRASFILSKFRLNIAAIHRYTPHPDGDYMEFTLDRSCTNMVLKGAKGIWHTEENPEGREGYTRVYLLASLQISRALPTFIVDYAADRAMPRATTWLKPEVERLAETWLEE